MKLMYKIEQKYRETNFILICDKNLPKSQTYLNN